MSGYGGAPLLVTGMPRTATSWVGKMLEASGALVYVNEPLNPQHPPGRSPGVLRADVQHAFQYISEDNEHLFELVGELDDASGSFSDDLYRALESRYSASKRA